MLKIDKYNDMKKQYIQCSILNAEALLTGDYKIANKNANRINKIIKKLDKNIECKEQFFFDIIECENIYAKSGASIDAIRQNVLKEKALKTLMEILLLEDKKYNLTKFGIKTFLEKMNLNI